MTTMGMHNEGQHVCQQVLKAMFKTFTPVSKPSKGDGSKGKDEGRTKAKQRSGGQPQNRRADSSKEQQKEFKATKVAS